jgi:hypothetical protein
MFLMIKNRAEIRANTSLNDVGSKYEKVCFSTARKAFQSAVTSEEIFPTILIADSLSYLHGKHVREHTETCWHCNLYAHTRTQTDDDEESVMAENLQGSFELDERQIFIHFSHIRERKEFPNGK